MPPSFFWYAVQARPLWRSASPFSRLMAAKDEQSTKAVVSPSALESSSALRHPTAISPPQPEVVPPDITHNAVTPRSTRTGHPGDAGPHRTERAPTVGGSRQLPTPGSETERSVHVASSKRSWMTARYVPPSWCAAQARPPGEAQVPPRARWQRKMSKVPGQSSPQVRSNPAPHPDIQPPPLSHSPKSRSRYRWVA